MSCNHNNPHDYKFCATCGEQLEKNICNCGYTNQKSNVFCGNCGAHLNYIKENTKFSIEKNINKYDLQKLLMHADINNSDNPTNKKQPVRQSDINKFINTFNKNGSDK